jgi:hypothetical protein
MKGVPLGDDYTSIMAFCYTIFLQGVTTSNVAWSCPSTPPLQSVYGQNFEMVSLACG